MPGFASKLRTICFEAERSLEAETVIWHPFLYNFLFINLLSEVHGLSCCITYWHAIYQSPVEEEHGAVHPLE